jgi:anti-anti-sigma factor
VKDDQTGKGFANQLPIMRVRVGWVATDTAAVQLEGEIDASNAGQVVGLADALDGATVIILDMSGVSFLGAAGLTALLQLAARLSLTGRHLVLTGTDHHPVRRPIAICGLAALATEIDRPVRKRLTRVRPARAALVRGRARAARDPDARARPRPEGRAAGAS